uniref:Antitoxin Phd_YefM, type II toxin-antitoxin system n=1 Tax=Candidatus Kentrum sp. LFY TaxID=2126342 RepID=A0A450UXD6_9GAMM|nr:MAG: Antitoxin Phd_YefM, type II toxin-antitoxin system [Candidatus Kentron sp. LFY]VFK01446.1 MAG: Antitoxin Phd_YefM, type II toxin-antitoxin system [Candidatus Kentron sp. LFY]VFK13472.1 MAG: Antitoxin Phd_YefM, type II toxin-antitoxin system [Candidatus Kentron sp. LFY]
MKMYTYSQARQHLSEVLNTAEYEEVIIRRRNGSAFSVAPKSMKPSPFDVPGIKTKATTEEILDAISESRASR